jgi:hypothetical protein
LIFDLNSKINSPQCTLYSTYSIRLVTGLVIESDPTGVPYEAPSYYVLSRYLGAPSGSKLKIEYKVEVDVVNTRTGQVQYMQS